MPSIYVDDVRTGEVRPIDDRLEHQGWERGVVDGAGKVLVDLQSDRVAAVSALAGDLKG
ncbi:MAG: hypothetical protein ACR2P0_00845 [Acidimicrobiales bacterium]